MMNYTRLLRQELALGLTLLAVLILPTAASAQDRAKVEIVPNIPHSGGITSVAFSPDGTRLLSGSWDKTLKLWDAASGRLIRTMEGHSRQINSVAFSSDGTRLLSGGDDQTLKLWDAATGRLIRTFQGRSGDGSAVAFSRNGTRLLSGGYSMLKLWDAESGQLIHGIKAHTGGVRAVAVAPDSTRLVSGGDDYMLKLWDAATGQLIRTFEGHRGYIRSVAFSSDGTRLLSGGIDGTLRLWDVASGKLVQTVNVGQPVSSAALSPDGTRLLSGTNDRTSPLKLWDAATGQLVRAVEGRSDGMLRGVDSVAFSPDGTRVLSGEQGTLNLWDAASGQLVRSIEGYSGSVLSVAPSSDGIHLLSGSSDNMVRLWDSASGRLVRTFVGHSHWLRSVAISADGTRVLSGGDDQTLKLWDAASGQLVRTFTGHPGPIYSVAFSPDGTRLLSGSWDKTVKLWDAAGGQLIRTIEGHSSWVTSAAFSPDGTHLVSGSWDKTVKLWNAASGQLVRVFQGHSADVNSVAYSPDGAHLLSGSNDMTLKLWHAASGQVIRTFTGHTSPINSVAFSPDGTRLLSGSWDKTVKLWDLTSGELIRTFEGHFGWVSAVAFSRDGTRVLSSSLDSTVRIWSSADGQPLASLFGSRSGEWLVVTPEGFFDTSAKGADMLSIVRGLEVFSIEQFYQVLYRPDLVREKLAGDPGSKVKDAAAKLDLAKLLDSGRVPSVAITSHKAQDISSADLVSLEARLADQGGGIGRAEWRINGITVGVVEKAAATAGRPIALKQAMALDPGENTIELTAYNGANLVASVPARTKIMWTGSEPTAPPRLYVLVVGINDYLDAGLKLTYAVPDAKTLAAALKQAGQGHYEDVVVTHVLDRDATADKLDAVFMDLAAKVRPRDVFVFFAAGHGKTLDGRYYFIPQDMRYHTDQSLVQQAIGQDKLQAWFARILAKKAVLMFDTCEAGSLTERVKTRGGLEQKAALGRLIQATGRATLTASTATQEAFEGHGGHGVFTFSLLDALGRADTNNNGLVELAELIQHVDGLVPAITAKRWGAKQFPQMDAYGSNFPLARQVAALAPAYGDDIIISSKPTHVNTEAVQIFSDAGGTGGIVQQLPPFTTVTLVKSNRGWVLIARDGKALGYVAEAKLHKLN